MGLADFLNTAPETLDASAQIVQATARRCNINMDPRWFVAFGAVIAAREARETIDANTIADLRRLGDHWAANDAGRDLRESRAITADLRAFLSYHAPSAA